MEVMKQRLKDLWKEGTRLCLVPGTTGELAKVRNITTVPSLIRDFFFFFFHRDIGQSEDRYCFVWIVYTKAPH